MKAMLNLDISQEAIDIFNSKVDTGPPGTKCRVVNEVGFNGEITRWVHIEGWGVTDGSLHTVLLGLGVLLGQFQAHVQAMNAAKEHINRKKE